ncbi:MAG: hypothetical protein FWD48_01780 [Oscillospiraceae bacterium]|nr:hypothetical protein [Oscillospiraceae bacterium]
MGRIKRLKAKGVKIQALVTAVDKYEKPILRKWGIYRTYCFPIVQYKINEQTLVKKLKINSLTYENLIGNKIEILYNPDNVHEICAVAEI